MHLRFACVLCAVFLMPLASLKAIYVGEWTEYGGWEPGYFVDGNNCCFYDPCQTYNDFYYPRCEQTEFPKICQPPPKVYRGEQIYRDGHWSYSVAPPRPAP